MRVEWVQEIRNQSVAAGVPFFFKQWGEWVHVDQLSEHEFVRLDAAVNLGSDPREYWRVGKRRAGRLLDGQTWDEMPEVLT
jgi:protein gp37